jgi:hypothetical protein
MAGEGFALAIGSESYSIGRNQFRSDAGMIEVGSASMIIYN